MSMAVTVLIPAASQNWAPLDLQRLISMQGFDLAIPTDFDTRRQVGWLPGEYAGSGAGFEYYCDTVADYLDMIEEDDDELPPADRQVFERHSLVVQLVTHSGAGDRIAAILTAAALAILANGTIFDNAMGSFHAADAANAWARDYER